MLPVRSTVLSNQILVITAGRAAREQMLEWEALLAIQDEVTIIDGGNRFNVYQVAKSVRRKTAKLHEALQNIKISRSFSCYQMAALLREIQTGTKPLFILDLLFSFYDEDIKVQESQRLLEKALIDLKRLSQNSPVVISTRPLTNNPERQILLDMLTDIAAVVWKGEEPVPVQEETLQLLPWVQGNNLSSGEN